MIRSFCQYLSVTFLKILLSAVSLARVSFEADWQKMEETK
jgi:hypothetical protein